MKEHDDESGLTVREVCVSLGFLLPWNACMSASDFAARIGLVYDRNNPKIQAMYTFVATLPGYFHRNPQGFLYTLSK